MDILASFMTQFIGLQFLCSAQYIPQAKIPVHRSDSLGNRKRWMKADINFVKGRPTYIEGIGGPVQFLHLHTTLLVVCRLTEYLLLLLSNCYSMVKRIQNRRNCFWTSINQSIMNSFLSFYIKVHFFYCFKDTSWIKNVTECTIFYVFNFSSAIRGHFSSVYTFFQVLTWVCKEKCGSVCPSTKCAYPSRFGHFGD